MVDGHRRDAWEHTSWIIACLINSNPFRKKGSRPVKPSDVNPMERRKPGAPFKIKMADLKGALDC